MEHAGAGGLKKKQGQFSFIPKSKFGCAVGFGQLKPIPSLSITHLHCLNSFYSIIFTCLHWLIVQASGGVNKLWFVCNPMFFLTLQQPKKMEVGNWDLANMVRGRERELRKSDFGL